MDQGKMLIKNKTIGSVFKCKGGIVHVNLYGASLQFDEYVLLQFARMIQEASSRLMDNALRIILEDKKS